MAAKRSNFTRFSGGGIADSGPGTQMAPYREIPVQVDTDGLVWRLKYTPDPQYVWVLNNGVHLDPFYPLGDPEYTVRGNILTLKETLDPATSFDDGAWFWVWYFRKVAKGSGTSGVKGKARQFGAGAIGGPGTGVSLGRRIDWLEARVQINLITPPVAGDTITIGGVTYAFAATINSILNPLANYIAIGGNVISNLDAAINAGPGAGIGGAYSAATVANPDVVSAGYGQLQAKAGSTLDSITLTSSVTGKIQFSLPSAYLSFSGTSHMTSGIMHDGDTVTIGSLTYTFKNTVNNANAREILNSTSGDPGSALDTPIRRLVDAINGGFGSGTRYSSATTANPDVTASYDPDSENMAIISKVGGAVSVALSTSSGGRFFWTDPALIGTGSSTDNVDWGHVADLVLVADMSGGVWIRPDSPGGSGFGNSILFHGQDHLGSNQYNDIYSINLLANGEVADILYYHEEGSASQHAHQFPTGLTPGQAYFIAFVRDSVAKTVEMFMTDGDALTSVGVFSYGTNPNGGGDPDTHFVVGNRHPNLTVPFPGAIQEYYIWNRTLTQSELEDAMNGNPPLDGLVNGCVGGDDPEIDISTVNSSGTVSGTTVIGTIH